MLQYWGEISAIGVSLAMDALAVSVALGAAFGSRLRWRHVIMPGLAFGFFQAAMPLAGWFAGEAVGELLRYAGRVIAACLLLWIGIKLLIPEYDGHEDIAGSDKLLGAIKTIIVADFVMSFDNVIAIAGAAQQAHEAHQTMLIIFGLLVSVPFIVFGSQVVLKLLDRFPIIIYFGGGLLGWIAGGMMVSDAYVTTNWPEFSFSAHYPAALIGAGIVIAIGHLIAKKKRREHEEMLAAKAAKEA